MCRLEAQKLWRFRGIYHEDEDVKTHAGNILTRLQLAHRTQAVIYALKKGIISLDEIELP